MKNDDRRWRLPWHADNYLYNRYRHMIRRCYYPTNKAYRWYGAKGIRVCAEWRRNPEAFRDWCLANGASPNLTLDRENNKKNYAPDNCRFVTMQVQLNNTSRNIQVCIKGEKMTLSESVEKFAKVSYATVFSRLKRGWNLKESLLTPLQAPHQRRMKLDGAKFYWKSVGHEHRPIYTKLKELWGHAKRGLQVQNSWIKDDESFLLWSLESGWKPGLELCRKSNSKGYTAKNCYWGTKATGHVRYMHIKGKQYTVREAADKFEIPYQTLVMRLHRGMSDEDAVRVPLRKSPQK